MKLKGKKVIVFKIGGNIKWEGREVSAGYNDIIQSIDCFKEIGLSPTVVTIPRYHKQVPPGISFDDWEWLISDDAQSFDLAIIWNGSLNCFGGVIPESMLYTYRFLNMFEGPILYCNTDTSILIGDASKWILNKQEKGNYKELIASDYQVNFSNMSTLCQSFDVGAFNKIFNKVNSKMKSVEYFPFELFAIKRSNSLINISPTYDCDLSYIGNQRGGKRDSKIKEFFCGHPSLSVDIYGKWKKDCFSEFVGDSRPNFKGQLDVKNLPSVLNKSLANVYISDKKNENTIWTNRLYEAIINRTILFIDIDNDPQKTKFDDFFYVSSGEELREKINLLKSNSEYREKLLDIQLNSLSEDLKKFNNISSLWEKHILGAIN